MLQVVYFQHFDPFAARDDNSQYVVFGSGQEFHADHLLTAKPDFMQVQNSCTSRASPTPGHIWLGTHSCTQ